MNEHTQDFSEATNALPPVIESDAPAPAPRKRRWWVYALAGVGGLLALGLVIVVCLVGYWHSLIRNYTAAAPEALPKIENAQEAFLGLIGRWAEFKSAIESGRGATPLRLSAEDLNVLIAKNPVLKDHLRVAITNGQLFGRFSFPLSKVKKRELQNRYLNGLARLGLAYENGLVTLKITELKANGRAVPRWILRKIQGQNFARDLDNNQEALAFLQKLDDISVQNDSVVLMPLSKAL